MDGIYCNACGAKLDEAPTLLPDKRPPCPACGSLARRFEQTVGQAVETDTAQPITPLKSRTIGSATVVQAEPATVTISANDATVRTETRSSGIRGPRRIIDHLVVQGRSLWWTQLTEEGGWLLQVVDEAGEEIATAAHYDPIEVLAAVAEFILPGHPG